MKKGTGHVGSHSEGTKKRMPECAVLGPGSPLRFGRDTRAVVVDDSVIPKRKSPAAMPGFFVVLYDRRRYAFMTNAGRDGDRRNAGKNRIG
jgi:hypothetical protein